MFNVVDHASGWKIEFIVRKERAFSREEFARRRVVEMFGVAVHVASPEDTVVAKLEWSKASAALGLADEWERAKELAEEGT